MELKDWQIERHVNAFKITSLNDCDNNEEPIEQWIHIQSALADAAVENTKT